MTVRTLHHYDAIGLLAPSGRTDGGYRLYSDDDVLRLQQILLHRELGLSLEQIRRLLDDPTFERRSALLAQRAEVQARQQRNAALLKAIDHALETIDTSKEADMKTLFDGFDPQAYEDEARERWGDTDAFREAQRRTRGYREADWSALKAEQADIMGALAAALTSGAAPDDSRVAALVDRHRAFIDRWFYPCDPQTHRALAGLYESDERFFANIDRHHEGLTAFFVAAIRAR